MVTMEDLGFSKGIIAETIVSTYSLNGKPSAAPMGVVMQDPERLAVTFFNSSATCRNIKANKCAVINLTSNVEAFYKTAFKEANPQGAVPSEWFGKAKTVNAPKLSFADATIEVLLETFVPEGAEKINATFAVQSIQAKRKYPQVQCRAISLVLESIIHATRVKAHISDQSMQSQVAKLIALIGDHSEVVNRVAPNSIYTAVMADLQKRITSWREFKT